MFDNVSAERFYQDDGDKTMLNWFLYEFANVLFMEIKKNQKLERYRKNHSESQIADFCVYFAKRLRKSMHDVQTGKEKICVFDARYIYEFYPKNTSVQTDALLKATGSAWQTHAQTCAVCPNQCILHPYELSGMFDNLRKTGWPT